VKWEFFVRTISGVGVLWSCSVAQAVAVDLTGTWQGKVTCSVLEQGMEKEKQSVKDAQMEISQSGMDLNIRAFSFTIGEDELLDGVIVDDGIKINKGEVGLVACESSVEPIDAGGGWMKATINPRTGKSKLTGIGIGAQRTSSTRVVKCKFNLERINTDDPDVPDCS
jgi:hypothetical protein